MWRRGPPGLSEEQRAETWRRWKSGHGVREIGRALGFDHGSIRSLLIQRGGFAPPVRRRAGSALTLAEREDISRGKASGASFRSIAERLGRAPSTVSREVARHGTGKSLTFVRRQGRWRRVGSRSTFVTVSSHTSQRVTWIATVLPRNLSAQSPTA